MKKLSNEDEAIADNLDFLMNLEVVANEDHWDEVEQVDSDDSAEENGEQK